jgi:Fe-S oxidoreductase
VYEAGDHVPEILQHHPIGLEGMDDDLVQDMIKVRLHPHDVRLLPAGRGWLLVEFGGQTKQEADDRARACMNALQARAHPPSMKLFDNPAQEDILWTVRESGLGATAHVPGQRVTWEGWEDSSVPPEQLGQYLRELRKLFTKYDYACALYGHFGQACVHTRIDFDLVTSDGIRKFRSFLFEATDLVLSFGGSLSGEHGDGQSRAELLPKMFGEELMGAFREFKSIWDPAWKMNPGKVVEPYRVDENLRLGADYRPPAPPTHFHFPADDYSFAKATIRCVGVGECRREAGKTMCPSYRVTREEMHSTRGRARLLFEMLEGNPLEGGWRNRHVKEALDLCLACKGCKGDCPVNVDMATYKAEFLAHYYQGRWRPRHAYSMGLIYWWARMAAWSPTIANLFIRGPGLRQVTQWLGGIAQERRMPAFAAQPFTDWFRERRGPTKGAGCRVLLWPDTFNNYFMPHTARAATEVLESLGYDVRIPVRPLCCGRPLYDFGMLDLAKRQLRQIMNVLKDDIQIGTPIVGLEPSCVAVFRDELVNLFPHHEDALRLSKQVVTLAELLVRYPPERPLPRLGSRAIVHGHCHHKAVMGLTAEQQVLEELGLQHQILDSGCCGMAGSFGFTQQHYRTSLEIGELVLLPAVRKADSGTLILADGFSCRQQIEQTTDRRGLHFAEALYLGYRTQHRPMVKADEYPERKYFADMQVDKPASRKQLVPIALMAVGVGLFYLATRWHRRRISRRRP